MPIYEYACRSCGHEFETLVCGAELEKKLSVFASPAGGEPAASACGSCGHPGGPGSCALN